MSSRTLGSRSSTTLGHITPTVDLTSHTYPSTKPAFETTGSCWTAPFRDGLPTPPGDMTGVAYNAIPSAAYAGKAHAMPSHLYSHSRPHYDSISSTMVASMKSNQSATQSAPVKEVSATEPASHKKSTGTTSGSALRIPSSINNSKGSLAEFAAQMTCLFWFEKTSKLHDIEDRRHSVPSLVAEAIPTVGFQKWVASILSTTQVSQNLIILALLFIYRLKKFNSGVKGKKGSEFRLMTVALMLGNKYLDDNTYTNKTWAEVSGIAVQEIHIMEVEFLSNIRYDLFCSKEEWSQWHTKLGLFSDYFNQASKLPAEGDIPVMQVSPPRLQAQSPLSKLPSPPMDPYRPQSQPSTHWYTPMSSLPYPGTSQQGEVTVGGTRKRGRDDEDELHPAKRVVMSSAYTAPSMTIPSSNMTSVVPTLPPVLTPTSAPVAQVPMMGPVSRLPPPNLPPSSNPMPQSLPSTAVSQLPVPISMGQAYNRTSNWSQQMPSVAIPTTMASGVYNTPSLPDLGRHQSPYGVTSATVSPAVSAYSVHTPQKHLSPSYFLANRNSPYRPVRSVHTLLIPPPSTSMQHQRSVPFDHMHYQPLGKGSVDRKTGLLPYIHPETWTQTHFQPLYPPTQFSG
ncbi:putative mucin [Penicillium brasilianum]|uniref:Putative mucin n=1 Tax=Penicillium brasilianum TaxID=104259 RepID=A0A1S9RBQ7_PENBI|nr:putative mucin [Penicillium brasilianum]